MPPATPKPRVAFVASLPHSGSTLVDRLLATHPAAIGIGEVKPVLGDLASGGPEVLAARPCSCGSDAASCPLWSHVLGAWRPGGTLADVYRQVLGAADAVAPGAVVVDSSKLPPVLGALVSTGAQVRVVRLTRDVRSWVTAMRVVTSREKIGGHGVREDVLARLRATTPGMFRWWHLRNRALDDAIAALDLPTHRVGYEEVATSPEPILRSLELFLGLPTGCSLDMERATTHQLFGSTMRFDDDLRARVVYDTRWMLDDRVMLPAALLRPVMAYNRSMVYSHGPMARWGTTRRATPAVGPAGAR